MELLHIATKMRQPRRKRLDDNGRKSRADIERKKEV